MKFDILNRFTGEVIFTADIEATDDTPRNIKMGLAVKVAVKARANLADADLADADLAGAYLARADLADANFGDGMKCTIPPVMFYGGTWPVMVSDQHVKIGCEVHTTEEWEAFDNEAIAKMDGTHARRFWSQWRDTVLTMAKAHQSKINAAEDEAA